MIERSIRLLWYVLVGTLPLQTVYIFGQSALGESTGGVWQYGMQVLYASDVLVSGVVLAELLFFARYRRWVWPRREVVTSLIVFGAVAQSVIGLVQVMTGFSPQLTWLGMSAHSAQTLGDAVVAVGDMRTLRAYGTMPHPNILGLFLAVGLLVAVGRVVHARYGLGWLLAVGVITLGLLATFSRGAWLGGVVGLIVFGLLLARIDFSKEVKRRLGLVMIAMMSALVFGLMLWWPQVITRFGVGGWERLEQRSIDERMLSWREGVLLWQDSPWWGHGIGRSTVALYESEKREGRIHPTYWYQPPHTIWLVVLVETGVIGFFVVLAMIGELCFSGVRRWREKPAFLAVMATFLVAGLFDHYLWTLYAGVMLWCLPFLLLVGIDKNRVK